MRIGSEGERLWGEFCASSQATLA